MSRARPGGPGQPMRLGAVGYLNARPLVWGLDRSSLFSIRFDVPSRCADLLHAREIDLGLIPSIELLRGPEPYCVVPGIAIASRGPVASVCLYATRPIEQIRSIALDTSSRTSVALVSVLCARSFRIAPSLHPHGPDLAAMLAAYDAALVIGDNALFMDPSGLDLAAAGKGRREPIRAIDLGQVWTELTGLPFVYAFWAGREGALRREALTALLRARDEGLRHADEVAAAYFRDQPERAGPGARYLRDNIKYGLGADEQAGLELFYRYAAEAGVVAAAGPIRFFSSAS